MMEILKKYKAMVIGAIALILYGLGYRKAQEKARNQQMEETIDAVRKTKKSHNSLSDVNRIKRLHNKYKR